MNTTANTTEHGYTVASGAGSDTRHIVAVTGTYYGAYAAAAVCGTSPRIRFGSTRWYTTEDTTYPTPAAALEARPIMMCRRCAAAVARIAAAAPAESTPAPAESLEEIVNTEDTPAAVTPVRADSVPANTPVTGYCGPNPVVYVRAVKPAPAPGHVVVTWVTENGGTFDETVTNAHIIYTAAAPILEHPGTWTEDAAHTWSAPCAATEDGEFHYTERATGECWTCKRNTPAAPAADIHPRALELVGMSDYPHGARVDLDPATAPAAEYDTARAVVTAYFQGGPGRGDCVDAVILTVTGGDSHPARNFATLDALEALQLQVSGNITAGQYQTLVDPDSYAGTIFIYGTWTD